MLLFTLASFSIRDSMIMQMIPAPAQRSKVVYDVRNTRDFKPCFLRLSLVHSSFKEKILRCWLMNLHMFFNRF